MTTRFDVFLSHNAQDKPVVERIALKLKENGLEPWFDKWHLTSGGNWQDDLAAGLRASSSCAVFIGANGFGDWQREELAVAQNRAAKDRTFRLFLLLLPGLSDPFDYNSVPPFLLTRNWVDLREGFEPDHLFQNLINAIKGIAPGPGSVITTRADTCPYRGLQTFDEEHAEFFFGRDADIQRLVEKLKATRFLAVVGASGSGKSSLVRAGLIPALRKNALLDSNTWNFRVLTPGAHPLTTLAAHLTRLYPHDAMHKTLDELGNDERTMHLAVTLALAERPATERVVWVIDQFEEVFTLCRDERERALFIANLLYAASTPDSHNIGVLTLRADLLRAELIGGARLE
jgi:hypothetical protein